MRVSEPSCAGNAYRVGGVRLRRGREQCGLPGDRLPRNNHRISVMGASVQPISCHVLSLGEAQKRAGSAHDRRALDLGRSEFMAPLGGTYIP